MHALHMYFAFQRPHLFVNMYVMISNEGSGVIFRVAKREETQCSCGHDNGVLLATFQNRERVLSPTEKLHSFSQSTWKADAFKK